MHRTEPTPRFHPSSNRLESWKEIAAYLNRSVRCVQLWERDAELPVHRIEHEKRGSVFAYASELDAWLEARRSSPQFAPTARLAASLSRSMLAAIAAGLLAVVGVTAYTIRQFAIRAEKPGAMRPVPLTSYPGVELSPSLSPDGSHVAFSWSGETQENRDIYVKVIGSEPPVRLTTHPAYDTAPSWSPDGRSIAFFRTTEQPFLCTADLIVMSAVGGAERIIQKVDFTDRCFTRPVVWTPDSSTVIVPDRLTPKTPHALFSIRLDTGEKRQITKPPAGAAGDSAAALSPDGKALAFVRNRELSVGVVLLQRVSTNLTPIGNPRQLPIDADFYTQVSWTRDGKDLLAATWSSGLWRIPASGSGRHAIPGTEGIQEFSLCEPAQRLAFVRPAWDPDVWRLDVEPGSAPTRLAHSTRAEFVPSISPNGRQIVFQSDRSGPFEIWASNSAGSDLVQLTNLKSLAGAPRWSPDGASIAFDSAAAGDFAIWVLPVSRGGPRILTQQYGREILPNWSRDGKWVYFGSDAGGQFQIWKIPSDGGPALRVTRAPGYAAMESLDSKTVYFASALTGGSIWKAPVAGGVEELVIGDLHTAHSFDVVADGIYYVSRRDSEPTAIRFYRFASRNSERIATVEGKLYIGLSVSPDGRWITYSTFAYSSGDLMLVENFGR